jgi:hypothetical protein
MSAKDQDVPASELILYRTEDAQTRIQVRLEGESVWLTQARIAELFQVTVETISEHLQNIFAEGEIEPERTVRKFRTVQAEGAREVRRLLDHYHLDAILAVGYRVRSARGTQFRQWATARLSEYLVKGFALDSERLKRGQDDGYFEDLLAKIRDIRSSEKMFWRKTLDIYATSVDYNPSAEASQQWCALASHHATTVGTKRWKHLLVPHDEIAQSRRLSDHLRFEAKAGEVSMSLRSSALSTAP